MTARHPLHPIPRDAIDPEYLGEGAYASRDEIQIWVSADRNGFFHAVALDGPTIEVLVRYARMKGFL